MAYRICSGCEHMYLNNNDRPFARWCRAFPNGIPEKIGEIHSHDKVIDSQVSDFVYMSAKSKKNRFGQKITIYQ